MLWKSYKVLAIIFLAGLGWALYSDTFISHFETYIPSDYVGYLRGINNSILFGVTAIFLYGRVRKQQEQLALSEKQYRDLFESNPNPMWVYHRETLAFIAINDAAMAKYGYSRDEFLIRSIRDIRPSGDQDLLDQTKKTDHPGIRELGIWQHIKKSGEIFPVSIVSHELTFDQQPCKMVMATDMTTVMQNEKKLREAYQKEKDLHQKLAVNYELTRESEEKNQLMAQIINKINNLVVIVGGDGVISWVNQAFTDFTGYSLPYATGKRPEEILFGPKTDQDTVSRLIRSVRQKIFFSGEILNYKKNGELYWTQLSISPIFDEKGNFKFFVSVENVITERKEREKKIFAQHTMLQDIAWVNSHQLRRPVCSVLGLIDVLKIVRNDADRAECMCLLEKSALELDQLSKGINQKIDQLELAESLH
ncbi:PAS domain S-box protein [Mucilaginibacter sp.]|uniref:PAS domain S-box protein n=1 Tax=Mucilaginibacter sp. TaxID=1882438 RepID=UPI0026286843|nr:PAS domain S-box protein [Mucilaginibacter sp.]MDB4922498.1 sensor protein [Mucilaginibacter sp.]